MRPPSCLIPIVQAARPEMSYDRLAYGRISAALIRTLGVSFVLSP